jgi:flagellar biosynthesis GTPase FlhF
MKNIIATTLFFVMLTNVSSASQEQHLASMSKDAKVIQNIIETTSKPTLGKFAIETTYLLGQGLVFELKPNHLLGISQSQAFAPPPPNFSGHVNVEDWVDMYADWGESIAAMTQEAMDYSMTNNVVQDERGSEIIEKINQKKEALRASLNLEKEKLKALYRAKLQLDKQLEAKLEAFVQEANQRSQEQKQTEIDVIKEKRQEIALKIEQRRKSRREQTESFKQNILQEREAKQQAFAKTILTNFCEYSVSLRHLANNEQVSFVFPNFSQRHKKKIYVFTNKQVKKCQTNGDKADNILSNVIHYEF